MFYDNQPYGTIKLDDAMKAIYSKPKKKPDILQEIIAKQKNNAK